jgi:hypothetical protein
MSIADSVYEFYKSQGENTQWVLKFLCAIFCPFFTVMFVGGAWNPVCTCVLGLWLIWVIVQILWFFLAGPLTGTLYWSLRSAWYATSGFNAACIVFALALTLGVIPEEVMTKINDKANEAQAKLDAAQNKV